MNESESLDDPFLWNGHPLLGLLFLVFNADGFLWNGQPLDDDDVLSTTSRSAISRKMTEHFIIVSTVRFFYFGITIGLRQDEGFSQGGWSDWPYLYVNGCYK